MLNSQSSSPSGLSRFEQLRYGREILRLEGEAVLGLRQRLDHAFCDAVQLILACRGSVLVTGMGKAGLVGQKIAATLASTGTRSHFLHPGEAVHGDLGRVHKDDVVLALSFSGETEEVVRLLPVLREMNVQLLAITGRADSTLARNADVTLSLGPLREACALGLAPSTSTAAMLAMGDAVALVLSRVRDFRHEDFARFHPAGSLGRKLAKNRDVMRPLEECRVAQQSQSIREVLVSTSRPGRRSGAIMLLGGGSKLEGIFTDSDLARLLERKQDDVLDQPISAHMTINPKTVLAESSLNEAVTVLAQCKISELPVVDGQGNARGMIDITDLADLLPNESTGQGRRSVSEEPMDTIPLPSKRDA